MSICRVLLRQSAQFHDSSKHTAIDATFYERDRANRHYCHRTNYRVQTLKVTNLVDTATKAVHYFHCSATVEGSDANLPKQIVCRNAGDLRSLAADKGYDKQPLREQLRELDIRPLIKHRIFAPYDHAHNPALTKMARSAVNDRNCQLSHQALARRRRVSAYLVSGVP